jgi:hypothetical protein
MEARGDCRFAASAGKRKPLKICISSVAGMAVSAARDCTASDHDLHSHRYQISRSVRHPVPPISRRNVNLDVTIAVDGRGWKGRMA